MVILDYLIIYLKIKIFYTDKPNLLVKYHDGCNSIE